MILDAKSYEDAQETARIPTVIPLNLKLSPETSRTKKENRSGMRIMSDLGGAMFRKRKSETSSPPLTGFRQVCLLLLGLRNDRLLCSETCTAYFR